MNNKDAAKKKRRWDKKKKKKGGVSPYIFKPLIVTLPNTPFKASRKSITGSSHLIVWEVIFQFIPASQFWIVEWFVSSLMIVAVSLYVYE
jgi:hypothetical protein